MNALAYHTKNHWWAAGMRRIATALLRAERAEREKSGRLLDLGCGPGWNLFDLPPGVWGIGVDHDLRRVLIRPFVLADAGRLPFVTAAFDAVLALDLLEQCSVNPAVTLQEVHRVLRPGGRLLVRVPAHPWLYGPHDRLWGGARRYRRGELADLVCGARLRVRRLTYADTILFPLAVADRLLARAGLTSGDDLHSVPSPLNRLLSAILGLEARWLGHRDLPFGLSLICLAESPTSP